MKEFIHDYGIALGQAINVCKSNLYLVKYAAQPQAIIKGILGFVMASLSFMYLGVPIFKGNPRMQHLQILADIYKLEGWKGNVSSMASHVELVLFFP